MAGFRNQFVESFITNDINVVTGSVTIVQFPNVPGSMFRLKAKTANTGSFFLGVNATKVAFEIDAGDDTGWFTLPNDNLNSLYHQNLSGTSDQLVYWMQK